MTKSILGGAAIGTLFSAWIMSVCGVKEMPLVVVLCSISLGVLRISVKE